MRRDGPSQTLLSKRGIPKCKGIFWMGQTETSVNNHYRSRTCHSGWIESSKHFTMWVQNYGAHCIHDDEAVGLHPLVKRFFASRSGQLCQGIEAPNRATNAFHHGGITPAAGVRVQLFELWT